VSRRFLMPAFLKAGPSSSGSTMASDGSTSRTANERVMQDASTHARAYDPPISRRIPERDFLCTAVNNRFSFLRKAPRGRLAARRRATISRLRRP